MSKKKQKEIRMSELTEEEKMKYEVAEELGLLDKVLKEKDLTRYKLAQKTGIQYQIIDNYYKNKVTRYDSYVLDRICSALQCEISDIIEYTNEEK